MSWFFVERALELTSFKYPLVFIRYRSSPKPLPRIYINKANLEHGEEESFTNLCCQNLEVILHLHRLQSGFLAWLKGRGGARGKEDCIYTKR